MSNFNKSYIGLRDDLLKYIEGESLDILDVGCSTGVNGYFLKNNRIASTVIGIEYDKDMAMEAEKRIDKVIVGDLSVLNIGLELSGYEFDYIILGDVLEHLYDPWKILKNFTPLLRENGKIVISLPNIQHIETFIQVYIHSIWPYNERGIFDKTHLRFFTYRNIADLINKSGLNILKMERVFRFRDNNSNFPKFTGNILKFFFPNLFTFQYVYLCENETTAEKLTAG